MTDLITFFKKLLSKRNNHSIVDATKGLLKNHPSAMNEEEIRKEYYREKYGI